MGNRPKPHGGCCCHTREGSARISVGGHPALERLRLRQLRGEDEGVEAGLVDERGSLHTTRGGHFVHPFVFGFNVNSDNLSGIAVPQRRRHIPSHEERCAVVARPRSQNVLQKTHILINELTISPKSFLTLPFLDI